MKIHVSKNSVCLQLSFLAIKKMIGSFHGPNGVKTLRVGPTAAILDEMAKYLQGYYLVRIGPRVPLHIN